MALTYLPVTSARGMEFFASNHKGNIAKAYIAHSPNLARANDTLWRRGYPLQLRKRILDTYRAYVNDPTMANTPFSPQPLWDWKEELLHSEHKTLEEIIYGGGSTPQPIPTLAWVTPPPDTAYVLTDYVATWKGGNTPYTGEIKGPNNVILNLQNGNTTSLTLNADGTNQPVGDYNWTITSKDGQTLTHKTTVKDITRDVAIFPNAGDTAKSDAITNTGPTQTITLKVGETFTGTTYRVKTDGTFNPGTGIGCTITPASSDTVASWSMTGQVVTITAKAVGNVTYVLESGDHSAHKNIHIVVT